MTLYICRTINNKLDKLLRKRTNTMPPKPPSFPLQSVQEVTDFNNISQEEYENAVSFSKTLISNGTLRVVIE